MPPQLYPDRREDRRHLSKLSINSWEAIFAKDCRNDAGQLRFLSRMCYIAMSHYLLYRGVLPKGVFKRRKLEDLAIYCFDSKKRWGHKLSEMIRGIKEAIEKKYVKQAFVMLNEDKKNPDVATEVFSIGFCYNEQHTLTLLDDKGNRIITFGYKGEKAFRTQVKHIIKKLSLVTKHLQPVEKDIVPYMKLTYYDHTPDEYEPTLFKHCESTYTFKTKPTFYNFGSISNDGTAMAFVLESLYINTKEIALLDDLLFDEAGYKDNDDINMMDVTADGFFDSMESPKLAFKSPQGKAALTIVISDGSSETGQQQTTVGTTAVEEATHSSENIERARQDREEEVISVAPLDSPVNFISLDADESNESEDIVCSKKVRESPFVKARPKRSSLSSPRMEFSRSISKRFAKASVSNRSVLKSPNDDEKYVHSPLSLK